MAITAPWEAITLLLTDPWLRQAWLALAVAALAAAPCGVLLVTRRMSLMGDAMSHAILPGVATGYLLAGFSLPAITVGGLVAGVAVAWAAGWASRNTALFEDATLAGFQLSALALGILLITAQGNPTDVMHLLFGSVLALDRATLGFIVGTAAVTLLTLVVCRRAIAFEWFDSETLRRLDPRASARTYYLTLAVIVAMMVAVFQALGALLGLTLLMLPALTARLWANRLLPTFVTAASIGAAGSTIGLCAALAGDWPPGPAVAATLSLGYLVSLFFAPYGLWRRRHPSPKHRVA
ncbi:iron ABC transporter [Hydrogenophilus thermoluteolus]|uniref:metal ABC transporter permease n=1 Tax=Hydrogenophilus thermoluteolus TaxID=297 RepID=UPI00249FA8E5|nr:metal ABC transporter permease [Hydrogenophilus thermoluteolus]GLW60328.1 iron ABC transporter [Hydrogenophilus thermoluteolus]